jgi:hypothetical protein
MKTRVRIRIAQQGPVMVWPRRNAKSTGKDPRRYVE